MTHIRTLMQSKLELIFAVAAVVFCIGLVWGVADEQKHTIENGKWFIVEGVR